MRKKFEDGGDRRFLHLSTGMWEKIDALAAKDKREWYDWLKIFLESTPELRPQIRKDKSVPEEPPQPKHRTLPRKSAGKQLGN